jgi:hypothetical protein
MVKAVNKFLKLAAAAAVGLAPAITNAGGIIFSEIHYNPDSSGSFLGDYFEFFELKNTSGTPIDISGYNIQTGVRFVAPQGSVVQPGAYYTVARSASYFRSRYQKEPDAVFDATSKLSNTGERLALVTPAGDTVADIRYRSTEPWPVLAAGHGFSIVIADENKNDLYDAKNWRNSSAVHGSPGSSDPEIDIKPVLVTEILANSVFPLVDSIEIFNPNSAAIDVSGWYLSDKPSRPKAFEIPAGSVIEPGGYLVFAQGVYLGSDTEIITATEPGHFGHNFGLSSLGEDIYIFSANSGQLTGYADGFSFPATRPNRSVSRFVNSEGRLHYTETERSFGRDNVLPVPGPLVFEEIMYAPIDGHYEYIKIRNISSAAVNIDNWDISGVGFKKSGLQAELAPDEVIYFIEEAVSEADFALFKNLSSATKIYTYTGALDNDGELIAILQAGDTVFSSADTVVPYYVVEAVRYNDKSPWPEEARNGMPLIRKDLNLFGNEPLNWEAGPLQHPSAIINGPVIVPAGTEAIFSAEASINPVAEALSYQWWLMQPGGEFVLQTESASLFHAVFQDKGTYQLRLIVGNSHGNSFPTIFTFSVEDPLSASACGEKNCVPTVYPTSTRGILCLDINCSDYDSAQLFNAAGDVVMVINITSERMFLNLKNSNLDTGYYILLLHKGDRVHAEPIFFDNN